MKGQMSLGSLASIGLVFVLATVVLSIGTDIVDDIRQDACTTYDATLDTCNDTAVSYSYNISDEGIQGTESLGNWLPTIATVAGAAIIITVISRGFGR